MENNSNPVHVFFEYGSLGDVKPGLSGGKNTHFAVGLKTHKWKEDRPFQFELDLNYRSVSFSDTTDTHRKFGVAELYLGPRLMISKTSPIYPTLSVLGGWYGNLGSISGLNALLSAGIYYNFTPPGTSRNGISLEVTYRTAKQTYNEFTIPPAFAIRIGIFF